MEEKLTATEKPKIKDENLLPQPEEKKKRKSPTKLPKGKSRGKPEILKKLGKTYDVLTSKEFALILFLTVQIGQSFHTTYVMHELTGMTSWASWIYAGFIAVGLDLIIVNLVGRGSTSTAKYFMVFYFAINMYAYYSNPEVDWNNFKGWFAIIPSFFIPFAAHQLSVEMSKQKNK